MSNLSKQEIENSAYDLIQYVLHIDDDWVNEIEEIPSDSLLDSSFREWSEFCHFTANNRRDILASAKRQTRKRLENDANFDLEDGIRDVIYCVEELFDMDEKITESARAYLDEKEMSRKHFDTLYEESEKRIIESIEKGRYNND